MLFSRDPNLRVRKYKVNKGVNPYLKIYYKVMSMNKGPSRIKITQILIYYITKILETCTS